MTLMKLPRNVTALSQLEIDSDKDWQGFGVTNLKELAAGMHKGDILINDGIRIVKVSPGSIGDEFTSSGSGHLTTWKAPPGA